MRVLLILFCYSFLLYSLSLPASADEKKEESEKAATNKDTDKKTATKTEKNKATTLGKPKAVPPVSLFEQQQKDLEHYIDSAEVKPLLAGPDTYLTLIKKYKSPNSKGVAILFPDWQQGATNPKAINFLRDALPNEGWSTITVQPSNKPQGYPSTALLIEDKKKENKTIIDEYQKKQKTMFSALMNLAKEYPGIVIVIAQGNNGALLVDLFSQNESTNELTMPNAMVLLSSFRQTNYSLVNQTNEKFAKQLALTDLPILDLYLQHDHPLTINKAAQRKSSAQKEMKVYYRQRQLNNNATGYYPEQELLSQINRWLQSIGW